jgi:outer membrane protein
MKRLFVSTLVVICLAAGVVRAEAQSPLKIGFVHTTRLMAEAPGSAEASTTYDSVVTGFRAELERLQTELETLQENFDRQQATLTATVRQERIAEIQTKLVAFQTRQNELEEQAQIRQNELLEPIMRRINQVIENLRSEGNYSFIFDAASGSFLTADPALDLTEQVLQRLRTAAGIPVAPAAPAAAAP